MFAYGIFKVIYAPHKAFKEISENPKYIGPILVMILFTLANTGFIYAMMSKIYVERTLPQAEQLDTWTENATLWKTMNGMIVKENFEDFINVTYDGNKRNYYGNRSIEFSANNVRQIWMQLDNIGPVNCADQGGYKTLYLRVKLLSPENPPENVGIYLFSKVDSDYFHLDLTENFSNVTSQTWNNLTISLASEGWLNNTGAATWEHIEGLKLEFKWQNDSNITLLMDGLFFGGIFKPYVGDFSGVMLNYSLISFMQFVIRWVFLGGILYILTKAFKANTVWRTLLTLVGVALITTFVQAAINAVAFSTLPTLYYPFKFLGGVPGESVSAFSEIAEKTWLVTQVSSYVQLATIIWTIALCAIATRLLTGFSWSKSFLLAAVAYFATLMLENFLLGV
ncbi:MAG: hypothetical protein QXE74_05280 [Candidatus Bathyarchaeia archaeon]